MRTNVLWDPRRRAWRVIMVGDRPLTDMESKLFGNTKFALDAIQESGESPGLYETAFLELIGVTTSHKQAIALMAEKLINAGLLCKEDFIKCLE